MYGEDQVKVLLEHYRSELPAETVVGDEFLMPAVITSSSDLPTEWKTFGDISPINQGKISRSS